ncbi:ubiquitin-binding protein Cue5p [Trichomonascus vanleenenianus]|uniref:CUE domain-containing protein n=1 Tax=Trichomonascus vanleenenianus TaxID=2268995 RepID=UPI003ECA4D62
MSGKKKEEEELTLQEPAPEPVTPENKSSDKEEEEEVKETEQKDESLPEYSDKIDRVEELEAAQAAEADKEEIAPTPPPKPPRPVSPFARAMAQLQEAFPNTEESVIRAVLVASGGKLDPAFNALLSMSDPSFKPDAVISADSPGIQAGAEEEQRRRQLEEDERLARQLAQEYSSPHGGPGQYQSSSRVRQQGYTGRYDEPQPQQERSFFDDDLPEIKKNLHEGFQETKKQVSSWMAKLKKKIDENSQNNGGFFGGPRQYSDDEDYYGPPRRSSQQAPRNRGYYDRDPDEISDDFHGISLHDNDSTNPPPMPRRRVSALGETAAPSKPNSNGHNVKWEPLNASKKDDVEEDPFFIGESDDEEDTTPATTNATKTTTAKK